MRPVTDVDRNLTLLPKLNNQRTLDKIINFYSIMGDMTANLLAPINQYIDEFSSQCRRNLAFMEKFKAHVLTMESSFDGTWGSNSLLNNFFYNYEKNVLSGHLISLHH